MSAERLRSRIESKIRAELSEALSEKALGVDGLAGLEVFASSGKVRFRDVGRAPAIATETAARVIQEDRLGSEQVAEVSPAPGILPSDLDQELRAAGHAITVTTEGLPGGGSEVWWLVFDGLASDADIAAAVAAADGASGDPEARLKHELEEINGRITRLTLDADSEEIFEEELNHPQLGLRAMKEAKVSEIRAARSKRGL